MVDPKYGTDIQSFSKFNPDFIFICVPTPMKKDGSQDLSIVESVFDELDGKFNHSLIVLKSTILPDFLHFSSNKFPNLVYNPEFLRENFASEDFINSEMILLAGKQVNQERLETFI